MPKNSKTKGQHPMTYAKFPQLYKSVKPAGGTIIRDGGPDPHFDKVTVAPSHRIATPLSTRGAFSDGTDNGKPVGGQSKTPGKGADHV
jgi:hypothetical protein